MTEFAASCIVIPGLCGVKQIAGGASNALFDGAAHWVASSSAWVWHSLGSFLAATSDPKVVVSAAGPEFLTLLRIAPIIAVCGIFAMVLSSLRRGDSSTMIREFMLVAPLLVMAVVAARPLATLVLNLVDALCSAASSNASASLSKLASAASKVPASVPGFALLLFSLVGVVGAVLLWFELVLRNAVLALLLALSPVILAVSLWPAMRRLALRLVESFIAIALSKFVVVVALSLGVAATQSASFMVMVTGIVTIILAVLAPFTLLRIVPLVELSALHAMDGMRQRASAKVRRSSAMVAGAAAKMSPATLPTPPQPRADLGFDDWPGGPELPEREEPGQSPPPPIGEPVRRKGRRAYFRDRMGPVLGWHFDE